MIAIYTRQSLDKKDSISIDTQIEFCKKEITNNEEYTIFQDKRFLEKILAARHLRKCWRL